MESINVAIFGILGSLALAAFTFVLGRGKQASETNLNEMQSVKIALETWQNLANQFKKEVDELRDLVKELQAEIEQLKNKS
jgi:predicted  nucleic acid-binding Zn-ribbon protein